jgi:hypothetical protein
MKHQKDRVIAIDYFRGICILVMVVNHAALFSLPIALITGAGQLWTGAAEMFFLLSGLTFGIVRGEKIISDFRAILKKTWRRAFSLYLINIFYVFSSLAIALTLVAHNLPNYINGVLPTGDIWSIFVRIFGLSYSLGWASFLMYYVAFIALAPFLMYVLRTRFWALVPFASLVLFAVNASQTNPAGIYYWFAIWQVYYVAGLVIARFRLPVLRKFYSLRSATVKTISAAVLLPAAIVLAASFLLNFSVYPTVVRLVQAGWLPQKVQAGYALLLSHKPTLDSLLMDSRSGLLRPAVAVLILGAGYLVYQKYKGFLLARSGNFFNTLGRDTLWIFLAQAAAIPMLSYVPIHHNVATNLMMTSLLVYVMWLVTKRRAILLGINNYMGELKASFLEAKYSYIYRAEDDPEST